MWDIERATILLDAVEMHSPILDAFGYQLTLPDILQISRKKWPIIPICAGLRNLTECLHVSSPLPAFVVSPVMDWSPRETFLAPHALGEFEYDVEAEHPITVLHKFNPDHKSDEERPVERFCSKPPNPGSEEPDFSRPDFWGEFESLPIFRIAGRGPNRKLPSGLCIFFCPRATPVFDDVPSELSDLCLPEDKWENIATKFCLNNQLVKAMRQKITSISVEPHHLLEGDEYHETDDTLLMCTVTSYSPGSSGGNEFAISSTHSKNANLTLAVVFGATPRQVNKVADLLANADEAIGHPLLMLGLTAELMLDNLVDPVEHMRDECVRVIRRLREMLFVTDRKGTHYAMEVESIRSDSMWLDEAAKTTKDILEKGLEVYNKVTGNIDNDDDDMADRANRPERGDEEFEAKLKRYVDYKINMRFQDIFAQLDVLIAVTRISVQDMCSMSTTMTGELSRRDAVDSAQTAKTGTLIAFLAMLYLPITSVATIFATPVFNFGNDWRDWQFHPTSNSSSSAGESGSSSEPVFSGWFWIYFGVSTTLTILTMEGWWRVAGIKPQETPYVNAWYGGPAKTQKRQLPHWSLWPVWWYIGRFFPVKAPEYSDVRTHGRGPSYDDNHEDGSISAEEGSGSGEKSETRAFTMAMPIGPSGGSGALRAEEAPMVKTNTSAASHTLEGSGGAGSQSGAIQQALYRFGAAARKDGGPSSAISPV